MPLLHGYIRVGKFPVSANYWGQRTIEVCKLDIIRVGELFESENYWRWRTV